MALGNWSYCHLITGRIEIINTFAHPSSINLKTSNTQTPMYPPSPWVFFILKSFIQIGIPPFFQNFVNIFQITHLQFLSSVWYMFLQQPRYRFFAYYKNFGMIYRPTLIWKTRIKILIYNGILYTIKNTLGIAQIKWILQIKTLIFLISILAFSSSALIFLIHLELFSY